MDNTKKPCHSPYCECDKGCCTHPGFYDARHEPLPTEPRGVGPLRLTDIPWMDFLQARRRALHTLVAEGKSFDEIRDMLSFKDTAHVLRVYEATK